MCALVSGLACDRFRHNSMDIQCIFLVYSVEFQYLSLGNCITVCFIDKCMAPRPPAVSFYTSFSSLLTAKLTILVIIPYFKTFT